MKLKTNKINKLVKNINRITYIGDNTYKEKFKQVFYFKQNQKSEDGIYLPYIISSFGRIFSIHNGMLHQLSPCIDKNGYELIVLRHDHKIYGVRIHRLVAIAFIKNKTKNKIEVNHIDGIKTNNHVWNLEWCTSSENKIHAKNHGLTNYVSGEKSGKSIYNNCQIHKVCSLLENPDYMYDEIHKITGVSKHMINDIYKNRYWTHISKLYDFSLRQQKDETKIKNIELVCSMISKNKSIKDIESITRISYKKLAKYYIKKHIYQ